ncbi:phosphorothioated DNA-binding restriction endonuclease [Halobacteriovorax sp. XZX-3]|uniref:phosphorothioated DNA-binding restriction endonuclease n=1 Tax=unclassified Halobacteriovorax TaxID=2639665 RepID=UPI003711F4F9
MIEEFIQWYENINKARAKDYYAPHKPITILYALVKTANDVRWIEFNRDREELESIISEFTKYSTKPNCLQPLWRLTNDSKTKPFWTTQPSNIVLNSKGDIPTGSAKENNFKAGFSDEIYNKLNKNKAQIHALIRYITVDNFPDSLHETLWELLGVFDLEAQAPTQETITTTVTKVKRDPKFPKLILSLYGNQCACCGLKINFKNNTALSMEAAHIKWKARGGDCNEHNGLALCPTHHYTFDRGIWTLNSDYRIELSDSILIDRKNDTFFTPYIGESIGRFILNEELLPSIGNIEWHRKNILK